MSCFKAGHRLNSREFIDEEFSKDLLKEIKDSNYTNEEAMKVMDFLHKFNSEFHKNVIKKGDKKALHKSKKLRRDCYSKQNARKRDILSELRFLVSNTDDCDVLIFSSFEDEIIETLDDKTLYDRWKKLKINT